jgi:glycosyltransferase involved in cell wall biosynthesis
VLDQTYRKHEIIVVDGNSTDETAAVLGAYSSRITYVRQAHNGLYVRMALLRMILANG